MPRLQPRRCLLDWIVLAAIIAICGGFLQYNYSKIVRKAQSGLESSVRAAIDSQIASTGRIPLTFDSIVARGRYHWDYSRTTKDGWPYSEITHRPIRLITAKGQKQVGNCSYLLIYPPGDNEPVGYLLAFYYPWMAEPSWYAAVEEPYSYFALTDLPSDRYVRFNMGRTKQNGDYVELPDPGEARVVVVDH